MSVVKNAFDWCGWPPPRGKDARCTFCRGPLQYPLLWWRPDSGRELYNCNQCRNGEPVCCNACVVTDIYVCRECCVGLNRGLVRDLKEIRARGELGRLGFHKAQPTKDTVFIPYQNKPH